MTSSRFNYLLVLSIAAIILAACNSILANQSATPQPTEEATTAEGEAETSTAESVEKNVTENPAADTSEEQGAIAEEKTRELQIETDEASSEIIEDAEVVTSSDEKMSHLTEEGLVVSAPTGKSLQPQLEQANIDLNQVVTLLPPDAIRAVNPDEVSEIMVTAAEAQESGLDPGVRVMGVSINGESHAYPIPFLSRHEIINAEVGGKLIAATW